MEAAKQVKEYGELNDLVKRIAEDESFGLTEEEILEILLPEKLCGRAENQVTDFINIEVKPILEKYKKLLENVDVHLEV